MKIRIGAEIKVVRAGTGSNVGIQKETSKVKKEPLLLIRVPKWPTTSSLLLESRGGGLIGGELTGG